MRARMLMLVVPSLKPGAIFRTDAPKPWYGRLVENIAPADPAVVQYAYAFTVPVRML